LLKQGAKALDEQAAWEKRQPGNEGLMLSLKADSEAISGRRDRAREFSQSTDPSFRRTKGASLRRLVSPTVADSSGSDFIFAVGDL
jgi:hypothetical protein